jgi:hypothetical protein
LPAPIFFSGHHDQPILFPQFHLVYNKVAAGFNDASNRIHRRYEAAFDTG